MFQRILRNRLADSSLATEQKSLIRETFIEKYDRLLVRYFNNHKTLDDTRLRSKLIEFCSRIDLEDLAQELLLYTLDAKAQSSGTGWSDIYKAKVIRLVMDYECLGGPHLPPAPLPREGSLGFYIFTEFEGALSYSDMCFLTSYAYGEAKATEELILPGFESERTAYRRQLELFSRFRKPTRAWSYGRGRKQVLIRPVLKDKGPVWQLFD